MKYVLSLPLIMYEIKSVFSLSLYDIYAFPSVEYVRYKGCFLTLSMYEIKVLSHGEHI